MTDTNSALNEYVQDVLVQLVQIDSVNPELIRGAQGEAMIAQVIAAYLQELGIDPIMQETAPNRPNVIGIIKGNGDGRSLMLNAHIDTVGVGGMEAPFSGEIRDGKVWGRGSYDMKSGAAAMLGLAKALSTMPLAGDVILTFVTDEEASSIGTQAIVDGGYRADAAIVTEPTGLRICCGHRGFQELLVNVLGRAAHGSRPHLGIDANLRAGRVLNRLETLASALQAGVGHPLLGTGSLHVPLMRGGSSRFVYAADAQIAIERRTVIGETHAVVEAEIQAILDALQAEDPSFEAELTTMFERPPFAIDADAPIVQSVLRATDHILGEVADIYGETWWMDSAILAQAGIETVIIGATGAGAHSDEEWVDLQSVFDLTQILLATARDFCG